MIHFWKYRSGFLALTTATLVDVRLTGLADTYVCRRFSLTPACYQKMPESTGPAVAITQCAVYAPYCILPC